MKRCPQCNRAESDDALTYCRVDGTRLVREDNTLSKVVTETETRLLPQTGATSPTEETGQGHSQTTTVLETDRASDGAPELSKPRASRKGVIVAAFALALAVTLAGFAYRYLSGNRTTAIDSVAVMPFVNASGDPNLEYLSDGVTESLINSLSQLPNLSVKGRSIVFRYKGQQADPQRVGSELKVHAVLSGRVVQSGDDLTLSLDLVDVRTGNQLWGEQYNRKLADLVVLQRELARDVSNKLRMKLSGADEQKLAKTYTENVEAYRLYLNGRFHWNQRTPEALKRSVEYFKRAIALDPSYALAHAGLADAYVMYFEYRVLPSREILSQARDAAQKALSLDDGLAEAHASLGLILFWADYDFAGAEREFKTAIELNPNYAIAHQWYGSLLISLGRTQEAVHEHRRAVEIDPLSVAANYTYSSCLLYARRYDEAVGQANKALELDANSLGGYFWLGYAYVYKGDYGQAVEAFAKTQELSGQPEAAELMRKNFAKGGWQLYLRGLLKDPGMAESPYRLAQIYVLLGNKEAAFAQLNKAYEIREPSLTRLKVDPRLDPLRSDLRFAELMHKVGLPQ